MRSVGGVFPKLGLLSVLVLPGIIQSQEKCFCLRDVAENLIVDCKKVGDVETGGKTVCYDPISQDYQEVQTTGWTAIPAGQPGCQPCITSAEPASKGPVIRGEEDKHNVTTGK